ncbi:MAG: argininosuccinate lyase [Chloroflexi bacterium]|nr:argininosuccinate lyase [Chloroflexota bacterium]MDA1145057.1 argininosuccinate lyase [Chloroflexota bacterium]MQC82942.1 argininosuccinate lyase [Chloroflexota bacterium]PKB56435.1 MAG: argininosuccinate lyase [SAR202 cluster bacterium Casp-Chloro-G1]
MTNEPGQANEPPIKLWGGRFSGDTNALVDAFNASIDFDRRLYREDIAGSIAHARMLASREIISIDDRDAIVAGLEEIRDEIDADEFEFRIDREDIHLNIEAALIERIGDAGRRLHTGRSRNDQVATDTRLFARAACDQILIELRQIRESLLDLADREAETVIPGYTHLQRAQPILLAHHLLAYEAMFTRDSERFAQARVRVNVSPLGAGALAGVTYPIDREMTARELGFDAITSNSLDAVSDRDFVVDVHSAASLAMVHLSRLSEELILWVSAEFRFAKLDDAFATGSSIMPQKKNADVAELTRGKSARVIGNLMQSLALLKSQPLAYNKDNQEDKEPLFDTVDTMLICLRVMSAMLPTMTFNARDTAEAAVADFALATDYADYLAKHGVPFRDAHEAIGALVARCEREGRTFDELSLEELQQVHPAFEADALDINLTSALAARDVPGGTAPVAVASARAAARTRLEAEQAGAPGAWV